MSTKNYNKPQIIVAKFEEEIKKHFIKNIKELEQEVVWSGNPTLKNNYGTSNNL